LAGRYATNYLTTSAKNDPERVNVYLDDEFAFGLSAMLVLARNLSPGQELSQHDIESLQGDEVVERSYSAALNFLSYRPVAEAK
jgi:regulatory protein